MWGPLELAGLPALRDLEVLNSRGLSWVGSTTASSFTAVGGLTRLFLGSTLSDDGGPCSIDLHPDALPPFTALQHLTLRGCDLGGLPRHLSVVGHSLRTLDVSRNPGLELSAAARDLLLSMPHPV